MRTSRNKFGLAAETVRQMLVLSLIVAPLCVATAQQDKKTASKSSVTGKYEGTAKNAAQEIIQLTFELTEKDGAKVLSRMEIDQADVVRMLDGPSWHRDRQQLQESGGLHLP